MAKGYIVMYVNVLSHAAVTCITDTFFSKKKFIKFRGAPISGVCSLAKICILTNKRMGAFTVEGVSVIGADVLVSLSVVLFLTCCFGSATMASCDRTHGCQFVTRG